MKNYLKYGLLANPDNFPFVRFVTEPEKKVEVKVMKKRRIIISMYGTVQQLVYSDTIIFYLSKLYFWLDQFPTISFQFYLGTTLESRFL